MVKSRFIIKDEMSSFHRIFSFLKKALAISTVLVSFSSCYNDTTTIGGDLIPSIDKTSVVIDTIYDVAAYTVETDTLPTMYYKSAIIGCINSDIFGKVKAGFSTRLVNSKFTDTLGLISPKPTADSLILTLTIRKSWGNNTHPINIYIYELTDSIESEYIYYNGLGNNQLAFNPTPVNYPTTYAGDSLLKIYLKPEFASKLMNAPDSAFISNYKLWRYMKGLHIATDDYLGSDGVLYFLNNMRLQMYYKVTKEDGTIKNLVYYYFGGTSACLNQITHDYLTAKPALKVNKLKVSEITNQTPQDTVFYVDGLGGLRGLIKFKNLDFWKSKMPIAIHRAELRFDCLPHPNFPIDSIVSSVNYYYNRYYKMDDDKYYEAYTNILDSKYVERDYVSYNKAKKYYSIDITAHLQDLIRGKISNDYIFIEPTNYRIQYNQGLFRTGNNSKPIQLIITYSKL